MSLVTQSKRAPSVHHKRRVGQHHKQSEHYMKPYWPYLPVALIVGIGLGLSTFWGTLSKNVLGYATDMSASQLLADTNTQRNNNGLASLTLNDKLVQAAQAKANDMAARDYWAHNTPEGSPPWVFFTNAGYNYQTAGENLAYGFDTSDAAITGWMNSPGHRANILNTTYTEVGFATANSANYQGTGPETIVVAEYASPQVAAATAPAPVAKAPIQATQPAPAPAPSPTTPSADTPALPEQETPAPTETNTTPTPTVSRTESVIKPITTTNVSRIQLLTHGNAPWSMFAVSVIATVCIAIFFFRHGLFWHRTLIKGERFIIKHKMLDIVLVGVAVLGFVLTRSAGVIH